VPRLGIAHDIRGELLARSRTLSGRTLGRTLLLRLPLPGRRSLL